MSSVFLDILSEVNEKLRRRFECVYPGRQPLASGNCGFVAIAMSKVLQKLNIEHFIRLYSYNMFDRNFTTWQECFDAELSGDHLICIHNDTWLDFTLNKQYKKEKVLLWNYQYIDIKDTNMDSLRMFCEANTMPWLEYSLLEELILESARSKGLKV